MRGDGGTPLLRPTSYGQERPHHGSKPRPRSGRDGPRDHRAVDQKRGRRDPRPRVEPCGPGRGPATCISMTLFDRLVSQVIRLGARALAAARVEPVVTGLEHIPADGPVLLVARHYHHLFDGVVLLVSMPRPIHFLVSLDWVKNSYARRLVTRATRMAHWPVVVRSDALRASAKRERSLRKIVTAAAVQPYQRRALSDSVALLAQGGVLVMFPEGYPNIDPHFTPKTRPEEILPFRAGFATIAAVAEKRLGVRVPIIPSGFRYAKTDHWIARLNLGAPAYLEDFPSRQLLVSHMERQIAELSGSLAGDQPRTDDRPARRGGRHQLYRDNPPAPPVVHPPSQVATRR